MAETLTPTLINTNYAQPTNKRGDFNMNREQEISREQPARSRTNSVLDLLHPGRMNDVGTRPELGRDIDYGCESFTFQDLPRRKGLRPATLRGPLHIQCNGHGDPRYLDELTTAVLSWPYVETDVPDSNSSNTIPLRLQENAAGY